MRHLFILFLICCPLHAMATENLIENIRARGNVTITDGVITQITADTMPHMQWKLQIFYNNDRHDDSNSVPNNWSFEQPLLYVDNTIGWISQTFTMPDDLTDATDFLFGLNGLKIDTKFSFDFKDVHPGETYTLQWRVLNNTQGSVSWTDMRLVHCGDGYELALGENNCSRACENQSVTGGHIPPNATRVDEPDICTYDEENLVCDNSYSRIGTTCEQHCTAGIAHLRFGNSANVLYNRKIGSPALCVEYNNQVCYGRLATGNGRGLNVELNGTVYHLID